MSEEKEVIEGYDVEACVRVGEKRHILAVSQDKNEKMRYMCCTHIRNELFGRYDDALVSDDYCELMKEFGDRIKADAIILEAERRAIGMEDPSCFDRDKLNPIDHADNIVGKVCAIDEKYLYDGYKDVSHQLFLIECGFGAMGNSRGTACMCRNLYTGEKDRVERYEIIGEVKDEYLPAFAKATLDKIKTEKTKDDREVR